MGYVKLTSVRGGGARAAHTAKCQELGSRSITTLSELSTRSVVLIKQALRKLKIAYTEQEVRTATVSQFRKNYDIPTNYRNLRNSNFYLFFLFSSSTIACIRIPQATSWA